MIHLISLPMADLTAPPLGIGQLKGYLSDKDSQKVKLFDAGLDFFYDCISQEKLNKSYEYLAGFLEDKSNFEKEPDKYRFFFECRIDAEYVKANVVDAVEKLKQRSTYKEWESYRKNVSIIEHALKLFSIPYYPTVVAYQKIVFPGSEYSFSDVTTLSADRRYNPLCSFFEENIQKYISDRTSYVGISISYSQQLIAAFALANVIRMQSKQIKIVAGGSFFSSFRSEPEKYDLLTGYFDAVIPDEGEEVWSQIAKKGTMENIAGCWIKKGKHFIDSGRKTKKIIRKCPDFDDFDLDRYLTYKRVLPYALSSGCYWGKCTFCSYHAYKSQCIERRPFHEMHKNVIKDLKLLNRKYKADCFFFVDEAIPPIVAYHLAKEIQEKQYGFHWFGEMRFEQIIKEDRFACYLKQGGCELVLWGLESGNDRVLRIMKKGTTRTLIQEILQNFRKAQIRSMPMFFVGFPTETEEEANDTIRLLKENKKNIQYLGAGAFMLLKGCPVHKNPSEYFIHIKPAKALLSYFDHFEPEKGMGEQKAEVLLNEIYQDHDLKQFFSNRVLSWNHLVQLPIEMCMKTNNNRFDEKKIFRLANDCTIFMSQYNWFRNSLDEKEHCYIYNSTKEEIYEISSDARDYILALDTVTPLKEMGIQTGLYNTFKFLFAEGILVADSKLSRRKKLGIQYETENDGIKVTKVCKAESNLKEGDIISQIESVRIKDSGSIQKIIRQSVRKDSVSINIVRTNHKMSIEESLIEIPYEYVEGYITEYSEIEFENNYFRTIWTRNSNIANTKKALVFIQGIECSSIDFQEHPNDVYKKLIYGMSDMIFEVVRLDLYGNGDSQGRDCQEYSFFEIVDLYRELVKQLSDEGYSVYLWGYSIGGIISSLIAQKMQDEVKGIVIFDTVYPDLFTYLIKNQLRQQRLQGLSIEKIKTSIKEYESILYKLLEEKLTVQQILQQNKEDISYFDSEDMFMGHVYQYAQELYDVDFEASLSELSVPVLMLAGTQDYLIDFDAHKNVYNKIKEKAKVKFVELQVNHWFEKDNVFSEQALRKVNEEMKKMFEDEDEEYE